jgi:hypothetical protein
MSTTDIISISVIVVVALAGAGIAAMISKR